MKKIAKIILTLTLFCSLPQKANAIKLPQSVGIVGGSLNGFSYKVLITYNFATSLDFGYYSRDYTLRVNQNFMYEANAIKGLYWFVGGGWGVGPSIYFDDGYFGLNAIGGLEYNFNFPLAMQFDFRPGWGMGFEWGTTWHYFDWGLNLSIRYMF